MRNYPAIVIGIAVALVIGASSLVSVTNSDPGLPSPNPDAAVAVSFYGDSYTLGTGASDPAKRWSTVICSERGWSEYNPSVNGLGFLNNRMRFGDGDVPDLVIRSNPDIVFVTMGLNDNFSYDYAPEAIHEQIGDDLHRLADALPAARFVVVEPFWYTDERPESLSVISGWVEEEASEIGADYIAGASHWIEGHPEWMAADGLHPNDAGYAEIGTRMDEALEVLGL